MATKYWALVLHGKVVDIKTEDPTGLFHESFRVIEATASTQIGQRVDDDGKLLPMEEAVSLPTDGPVEAPVPAPELTAEEKAEAIRKANEAELAPGLSLDLADRHL